MKPYYEHGGITIFNCDCRELLPDVRADLLLTDPPYGIGESRKRVMSRKQEAEPRDYGEFDWDSKPASDRLIAASVLAADYAIIWGGNYFHLPPSSKWLVWDKLNSGDFADCELAWTNLPGAVRKFAHRWNGMLREGREQAIPRVHPAQKPVALMKWCLTHCTANSVLDPFMGSATTLIAAKEVGLTGIGIEIEERYCEIAAKRLSQEVFAFDEPMVVK